MDLRQIRCFVAVAEELHFHNAARRLGVAQPALSRTIKTLETELGTILFERSNRKVVLTQAGQTMLEGSNKILHLSERLVENVRAAGAGKKGTLRLGYTDNAINGALPKLLKQFQSDFPDIELQLHHLVTSRQFASLEDESIDLGFATASQVPPGFESLRLQREHFVCLVPEDHRFASLQRIKLKDLRGEPMVRGIASEWAHFHAHLRPAFLRAGFEPTIAQESLTTSSILRLVSCGMGIAILTETTSETPIPGVKRLEIDDMDVQLSTLAIWKAASLPTAKSSFVGFLQRKIASEG